MLFCKVGASSMELDTKCIRDEIQVKNVPDGNIHKSKRGNSVLCTLSMAGLWATGVPSRQCSATRFQTKQYVDGKAPIHELGLSIDMNAV
jgi:hypothetical protein